MILTFNFCFQASSFFQFSLYRRWSIVVRCALAAQAGLAYSGCIYRKVTTSPPNAPVFEVKGDLLSFSSTLEGINSGTAGKY